MPTAGQIRAGDAFVELALRDRKFLRGLAASRQKLQNFSRDVGALGRRMLAVGAAAALPLGLGTKLFADFQKQMATVSTMLDRPGQHLDRFRAGVEKMAVGLGESTETLTKGLYDILSASVAPEKALDTLGAAAKAAKAGLTDTGVAADAITTILNAYGLGAERAGDVSDLLFAIVKRGKTTFADLAPAIGNVASIASTAGVTLEELGAAVALLTRNGVQTDNAMTAINATIAAFLKPSEEAAQYARELGFEMSTATLKSEGLLGVFERIAALPPDAVAKLFPNIRALKGVIPALAKVKDFRGDIELMAKRAGSTEEAYKKMAGTLDHRFGQAKQQAIGALRAIGDALKGLVTDALNAIGPLLADFKAWIDANGAVAVAVAKITAGVILLGGALVTTAAAAKLLAIVMVGWEIAVKAVAGIKAAIVGLNALLAQTVWLNKAVGATIVFLASHPIVAGIAALAAIIGGLALALRGAKENWEATAQATRETLEKTRQRIAAEREMVARLDELSKQQRLTNTETAEAERLLTALGKRYNTLGAQVDKATGRLTGLRDVLAEVNKQQAEEMFPKVAAHLQAVTQSLRAKEAQAETAPLLIAISTKAGSAERHQRLAELAALQEEILDLREERNALMLEHRRLRGVMAGAPGAPAGTAARRPRGPGLDLSRHEPKPKWVELDENWAARQDAFARALDNKLHELRVAHIEDEQRRTLEGINERYRQAVEAAKREHATEANLQRLDRNRRAELFNAREDFRRRQEEAERDRLAQLAQEAERLKIEMMPEGREREKALLDLQRRAALAEARKAGEGPRVLEAIERNFALRGRLAEQQARTDAAAGRGGTFYAQAAARMGQSPWHARLLAAVEKAAKAAGELEERGRIPRGIPVI